VVCLFITTVSPTKTDERIQMPQECKLTGVEGAKVRCMPATCHILVPSLPGTKLERNQEETGENVGNDNTGKVGEMGGKERERGT